MIDCVKFERHLFLPNLEMAKINGCSVLKGMSFFGYDQDFEVMDPSGDIYRFDDLPSVVSFINSLRLN